MLKYISKDNILHIYHASVLHLGYHRNVKFLCAYAHQEGIKRV